MTMLPINSVINPLLYDDTITFWVASSFKQSKSVINSTISSYAQKLNQRHEVDENIAMDETHHDTSKPSCSASKEARGKPNF